MKQIFLFSTLFLLALACTTKKSVVSVNESNEALVVEDSVEYEMKTFDTKFETWYKVQNNPSQYRSQEYYENWNRTYVPAWNSKIKTLKNDFVFEPIVGYDQTTDYGFELNHKLFYYFQYVEKVLKVKIIDSGPKSNFF